MGDQGNKGQKWPLGIQRAGSSREGGEHQKLIKVIPTSTKATLPCQGSRALSQLLKSPCKQAGSRGSTLKPAAHRPGQGRGSCSSLQGSVRSPARQGHGDSHGAALTVPIRIGLDCSVHFSDVFGSHPPAVPQAGVGQHLKFRQGSTKGHWFPVLTQPYNFPA